MTLAIRTHGVDERPWYAAAPKPLDPLVHPTRAVALLSLLVIAGCASVPPAPPAPSPDAVRDDLVRRMPASLADRDGWAADIQTALAALDIAPIPENLCAVLAVTAQESGYKADPAVPNLPTVARGEIIRRAAARRIPAFMVDAALRVRSSDGRTYDARLAEVRTERELSGLYEDLTDKVPLGRRLFDGYNPVETGGPMQVGIAFAESRARGYPYPVAGSIRREVFTRRGGLYFGIAHLLGYETPYTRKVHRFADYNAGWYASRNAGFQHAVAVASAGMLALDGDLLAPGAPLERPGETERALRSLSGALGMDDRAIRAALLRGDRLSFNDEPLFARVFALAEQRGGVALPRERVPSIRLDSPKFTRELTTEWFATRVDTRYRQCMAL